MDGGGQKLLFHLPRPPPKSRWRWTMKDFSKFMKIVRRLDDTKEITEDGEVRNEIWEVEKSLAEFWKEFEVKG